MSVINNVLKDLENKSSAFTPLELADVPNTKTTRPVQYSILMSGSLFLVVALLVFYFLYPSKIVDTEAKSKLNESPDLVVKNKLFKVGSEKSVIAPLSESMNEKALDEVTGLQINESQEFLELTLQLPLGAQSFLKYSGQNRYVFLISNATKKIISPDFHDNLWLKNISINEEKAGLEIKFHTRDDVFVETHHTEKGENYYWNIRLKKSKPIEIFDIPKQQNEIQVQTLAVEPNETLEVGSSIDVVEKASEQVETQDVQHKLVKLEIKLASVGESDVELLQKVNTTIQKKNWLSAQKQLEMLLNSSVDKKARIKLLKIFKLQQKSTDMKLLLAKSRELYPEEIDFLIMEAGLLFSEKQYLTLIKRYKTNLDNITVINLVAASFQGINQHEEAIDYYQRSLKINPQQPRKWVSLAISQEQLSQFNRAGQSYKMALSSGSLNNKLLSFIQKRLQQLHNYEN